ncbi:hypothetical protein [Ruegeria arenilitoris]|uniref:hypothetical protein n=1 Tax=Ruegeria arenilitoris TaxID=1173585 RepID=UPI00147C5F6C|nr:hypothetical protein [Ruegeria arenilitoris]
MHRPLSKAIEGKHGVAPRNPPYLMFVWTDNPGWALAHKIAGLEYDLSELFRARVELVSWGPGCFYAVFQAPKSFNFELHLDGDLRETLNSLKRVYEAEKLTIVFETASHSNKKITIH